MKNFVQPGDELTLTSPTGGTVAGTAYLIGVLLAVAASTTVAGDPCTFSRKGVFTLPKATGAAWAEGDLLYWDNSAFKFTKTSSGNTKAGIAVVAAASGDATGKVLLVASI